MAIGSYNQEIKKNSGLRGKTDRGKVKREM